jgi:flagellar basal body rod protein FlgG
MMRALWTAGVGMKAQQMNVDVISNNLANVNTTGYKKERISVEFESAIIDPIDIAKVIDSCYNAEITKYSLLGKQFSEQNSWAKLKQQWLEV